jgi:hypothetical protein
MPRRRTKQAHLKQSHFESSKLRALAIPDDVLQVSPFFFTRLQVTPGSPSDIEESRKGSRSMKNVTRRYFCFKRILKACRL